MPNHTVTDVIAHTAVCMFGFWFCCCSLSLSVFVCPGLKMLKLRLCVILFCIIFFVVALCLVRFFLRARSHVPLYALYNVLRVFMCERENNWANALYGTLYLYSHRVNVELEFFGRIVQLLLNCSLHSLIFAEIVRCVARALNSS